MPLLTSAPERLFAILYQPGPAWKAGLPLQEQDLSDHAAYMRERALTGAITVAGPLLDTGGGLVIVRAATLAQAKELMDADPAVSSGLFVGAISGWIPIIDPTSLFQAADG